MDVSSMSKEQIEVAVNALVDRLFGEPVYGLKARPEGVFRQFAFQLKTELQTAIARTEQLTEKAQQSLGSWGSLATVLGSHAGWLCEQWAKQTKELLLESAGVKGVLAETRDTLDEIQKLLSEARPEILAILRSYRRDRLAAAALQGMLAGGRTILNTSEIAAKEASYLLQVLGKLDQ